MREILRSDEWNSRPRVVAGMMSGTSLDGIDVTIGEFRQYNGREEFTVIHESTRPFTREEYLFFKQLIEKDSPIATVCNANVLIISLYAEALRSALDDVPNCQLDAIGIHGQTVWHSPTPTMICGRPIRSTLQLSSPSVLASEFKVPIVSDFRAADVALGGQGAPLIPIFDYSFLRSEESHVTALNIGGMANITLLPLGCTEQDIIAFDTGPGNVWIDAAMHQFYGKRFDDNGSTARAGRVLAPLLAELQRIEFVYSPPPKSTGRELFTTEYVEDIFRRYMRSMIPPEDIIATLTAFTAFSIAENIKRYGSITTTFIVSGGGAHNSHLLNLLQTELPDTKLKVITDIGISADGKEALCFGYLAYRTLGGRPSNIPSVTGATSAIILGSITLPTL